MIETTAQALPTLSDREFEVLRAKAIVCASASGTKTAKSIHPQESVELSLFEGVVKDQCSVAQAVEVQALWCRVFTEHFTEAMHERVAQLRRDADELERLPATLHVQEHEA